MKAGKLAAGCLLAVIDVYRHFISPLLGPCCRFQPSCSEYGRQAIARHGALKGSWLLLRRLSRCHPFSGRSGYDPVPEAEKADGG